MQYHTPNAYQVVSNTNHFGCASDNLGRHATRQCIAAKYCHSCNHMINMPPWHACSNIKRSPTISGVFACPHHMSAWPQLAQCANKSTRRPRLAPTGQYHSLTLFAQLHLAPLVCHHVHSRPLRYRRSANQTVLTFKSRPTGSVTRRLR